MTGRHADGWMDLDVAQHAIGVRLGLFPERSRMQDFKWVFWTDNLLGGALYNVLQDLVEGRVWERQLEEGTGVRFRPVPGYTVEGQ